MQNQIIIETENKKLNEFLERFSKINEILRDSDLKDFVTLITTPAPSSEDEEMLKRAALFEWYKVIKKENRSKAVVGQICILMTHSTEDERSAFIFNKGFDGHNAGPCKIDDLDKDYEKKSEIIKTIMVSLSHYLHRANLEKIPTPIDIAFLKRWGI